MRARAHLEFDLDVLGCLLNLNLNSSFCGRSDSYWPWQAGVGDWQSPLGGRPARGERRLAVAGRCVEGSGLREHDLKSRWVTATGSRR